MNELLGLGQKLFQGLHGFGRIRVSLSDKNHVIDGHFDLVHLSVPFFLELRGVELHGYVYFR